MAVKLGLKKEVFRCFCLLGFISLFSVLQNLIPLFGWHWVTSREHSGSNRHGDCEQGFPPFGFFFFHCNACFSLAFRQKNGCHIPSPN